MQFDHGFIGFEMTVLGDPAATAQYCKQNHHAMLRSKMRELPENSDAM
jgi:hypothetical protein